MHPEVVLFIQDDFMDEIINNRVLSEHRVFLVKPAVFYLFLHYVNQSINQ